MLLAAILLGFAWQDRNAADGQLNDDFLFLNGTLMRGLELHPNLEGAEFVEEISTSPRYRVHSIDDVHPGMYRVNDDEKGASIPGELYLLPTEVLLRVIEGEPEGPYRGPVQLADGRTVPGILYRRDRAEQHPDITELGGWRGYISAARSGS